MEESNRQRKVSRMVQRELGSIFLADAKNMFGPVMISITQVRMSPDLSLARVYLSIMPGNPNEVLTLITEKKSEIRRLLGNKIRHQVRVIPELAFFHDDSAAYAAHIDKLLSNLNIPAATDDEEEEEEND